MSTIVDVAKFAGVSTATVSRVINMPETVRPATREKVKEAMGSCSYKYNALAKGFATRKTRIIGVVIPSITNPIFAESTRGIQDVLNRHGYHTVLGNTDYTGKTEEKIIQVFTEMQVDGLIITTTDIKSKKFRELTADGFPFILNYSTIRTGPVSCVGVDNFAGGYKAASHLLNNHHRRVGMLAGSFAFSDKSCHRWYGYRKCLKDHDIEYDPNLVIQSDYRFEDGKKGLDRLMDLAKAPTAIFCSNDYLAMGVMEKARAMGLSIPNDLSLVGFDDMPLTRFLTPGLDTIRQPAYEIGRKSARIMVSWLNGKKKKTVHKLFDTQLIVRGSVTPPRH